MQQNNFDLGEECVEWRVPENFWFDQPCFESKRVLCQQISLLNEERINNRTSSVLTERKVHLVIIGFGLVVVVSLILETCILLKKKSDLSKLVSQITF